MGERRESRSNADRALSVVALAVGSSAGLLVAGPAGSMLGAAGVQAAVEATGMVFQNLSERRRQQASLPLVVGAAVTGESLESFARHLVDDRRLQPLVLLALTSAAGTGLEAKLRALGAVLAEATQDEAELDLNWLIADALSVVEAPHLVVLNFLNGVTVDIDLFGSGLPFERLGVGLRPIFTALESKGLVLERSELREENVGIPGRLGPQAARRETVVRHRHAITPFGREIIRRIVDAPDQS